MVEMAAQLRVPVELVRETRELGRLPVVNFAAGGIATPADAAMMMQLGCDGVFVGSVCFGLSDPRPPQKKQSIYQRIPAHLSNM